MGNHNYQDKQDANWCLRFVVFLLISCFIYFKFQQWSQSKNLQIFKLTSGLDRVKHQNQQLKNNFTKIAQEDAHNKAQIKKLKTFLIQQTQKNKQIKKIFINHVVQPLIEENNKISVLQEKYFTNLYKCVKFLQQIKLQPNQDIGLYTQILTNISEYYKSHKKYEQLIVNNKLLKKILQQNKKTSQKTYLLVLQQIGEGYYKLDDSKSAISYYMQMTQVRAFYSDDVSSFYRGTIFGYIGKSYEDQGQIKKALNYYNKALQQMTIQANGQKYKNSEDFKSNNNKIELFVDYLKKSIQKIEILLINDQKK